MNNLAEDSCNSVWVSCLIQNPETGECVRDPATGECKEALESHAEDVCVPCRADGCLSRSPGFWGTHPHIAAQFLPLDNCGLVVDTTLAMTPVSATEDICSIGNDFKSVPTSPQTMQLIRQRMAAHLNVAATFSLEGRRQ